MIAPVEFLWTGEELDKLPDGTTTTVTVVGVKVDEVVAEAVKVTP